MDNQMPGLCGVEATGRIRAYEESAGRRRTPIIAPTASTMRGDREHFLEVGMDSYLAKPFKAEELYESYRGPYRAPAGVAARARRKIEYPRQRIPSTKSVPRDLTSLEDARIIA